MRLPLKAFFRWLKFKFVRFDFIQKHCNIPKEDSKFKTNLIYGLNIRERHFKVSGRGNNSIDSIDRGWYLWCRFRFFQNGLFPSHAAKHNDAIKSVNKKKLTIKSINIQWGISAFFENARWFFYVRSVDDAMRL